MIKRRGNKGEKSIAILAIKAIAKLCRATEFLQRSNSKKWRDHSELGKAQRVLDENSLREEAIRDKWIIWHLLEAKEFRNSKYKNAKRSQDSGVGL